MPSPARSVFMAFLALYIVTCAFVLDYRVVEAILSGHADDVSNNTLLGVLLSAWNSAALGVIVGFFYGRSSDSDRKTELIGASTPPANVSTTTTPGKTVTESTPAPMAPIVVETPVAVAPVVAPPASPAAPASPRPV